MWYPFLFMVGIYLMIKDVPEFKRYMYCIIIGFFLPRFLSIVSQWTRFTAGNL